MLRLSDEVSGNTRRRSVAIRKRSLSGSQLRTPGADPLSMSQSQRQQQRDAGEPLEASGALSPKSPASPVMDRKKSMQQPTTDHLHPEFCKGRRQSMAEMIMQHSPEGVTLDDEPVEEPTVEMSLEEAPSSLFIFSGTNPFRLACLSVVQNWWFHQFILVCIIINSITLAMDQPAVNNPDGLQMFLLVTEYIFTVIFFIEMCLKVIALGFIAHDHAYLRTPWNVLDFVIVVASIVSLFVAGSNFSALRVVRVLRPLRSVSRIRNLKLLIAGLFQALPSVLNNLLLFGFINLVFAIAGVQLWAGQLNQRCYVTTTPRLPAYTNISTPSLVRDDFTPCGGAHGCALVTNVTTQCEKHRSIYTRQYLNYDNFLSASLLVLKVTTFDNWPDDLSDAMNFGGDVVVIYFILLTLIGGYICVNLFLAVLTQGYSLVAHQVEIDDTFEVADAGVQTDFKHIDRVDTPPPAEEERLVLPPIATSSDSNMSAREPPHDSPADGVSPRAKEQVAVVPSHQSKDDFGELVEEEHPDGLAAADDDEDEFQQEGSVVFGSFRYGGADDDRNAVRKTLGNVIVHRYMEVFMMLVTLLNVVVLAIDHHGIDPDLEYRLNIISVVCTAVFGVEISIKIFAFGPQCLQNGFNALDFTLVAIAVITLSISGGESSSFSAFRAIRILRVFRFMSRFESLQTIIDGIIDSVSSVGYLSLLILLFLYVYSIMGMQVFGNSYGANDPEVRDSMGTIWESAILCFIVITGDNWTDKMKVGMSSFSEGWEFVAVLYFVTLYMIGNYILINLSVAIIVDKLQEKMDELDERQQTEEHPPLLLMPSGFITQWAHKDALEAEKKNLSMTQTMVLADDDAPSGDEDSPRLVQAASFRQMTSPKSFRRGPNQSRSAFRRPTITEVIAPRTDDEAARVDAMLSGINHDRSSDSLQAVNDEEIARNASSRYIDDLHETSRSPLMVSRRICNFIRTWFVSTPPPVVGDSLYIFSPTNPLRRACLYLIGLPFFHGVLFFCIIANVVFLAFDNPGQTKQWNETMFVADIIFACIFTLELMIKVVAIGAIYPKKDDDITRLVVAEDEPMEGYFRDPWNCVDAFVVVVSIIGLFVPVFKVLRSLRTVRIAVRVETTRIILVALFEAIPHVMHGLLLSSVVFLVFGILGVALFKGRFYRCNDPDITARLQCVGMYNVTNQGPVFPYTTVAERQWQASTYNFDHLGKALLTLFVVSVSDGWSEIMFDGMDIVDADTALRFHNAPWFAIYFVVVFIACNFFALNLMIGILVNYFSKKKQMHDGSAVLTPQQRLYAKARDVIDATVSEEELGPMENQVCEAIHDAITYKHPAMKRLSVFDMVLMVFITVNVVAVAMEYDDMPADYAQSLFVIQLVCLITFTAEMVIKWAAYGPWYFTTGWNRFDFVIVVAGWLAFGLPAIKFLSFLRVFRVVKLIRGSGVEKLLLTLFKSVMSLLNVVAILVLTYFIFAVAGVELFGRVKLNGALDESNNFRTVPRAMLILYQCATTENWNGVMESLQVQPPECDPAKDECGNEVVALIYFLLFMVACTFIALQLFVAIIVEIFTDDGSSDGDPVKQGFIVLKHVWSQTFGEDTVCVHYTRFIALIPDMPTALTDLEEDYTRADVMRFLATLPIPVDKKRRIFYKDVVHALAFKKYQVDTRTMNNLIGDAMSSMFIGSAYSIAQLFALDVIAELWRAYQVRSEMLKAVPTFKDVFSDCGDDEVDDVPFAINVGQGAITPPVTPSNSTPTPAGRPPLARRQSKPIAVRASTPHEQSVESDLNLTLGRPQTSAASPTVRIDDADADTDDTLGGTGRGGSISASDDRLQVASNEQLTSVDERDLVVNAVPPEQELDM